MRRITTRTARSANLLLSEERIKNPLDKIFSLQYYAEDNQERLVDAGLSNRGVSIRVGGLAIGIDFVALEFSKACFVNSTLVLVSYALKIGKDSINFRLVNGRRETRSKIRARPLTNFNQSFSQGRAKICAAFKKGVFSL